MIKSDLAFAERSVMMKSILLVAVVQRRSEDGLCRKSLISAYCYGIVWKGEAIVSRSIDNR